MGMECWQVLGAKGPAEEQARPQRVNLPYQTAVSWPSAGDLDHVKWLMSPLCGPA